MDLSLQAVDETHRDIDRFAKTGEGVRIPYLRRWESTCGSVGARFLLTDGACPPKHRSALPEPLELGWAAPENQRADRPRQ